MTIEIILNRFKYFFSSLLKIFFKSNKKCTYCNSSNYEVISKKFLVTKLVRCINCEFMFRIPTTNVEENNKYYQYKYTGGGKDLIDDKKNFTVDVPDEFLDIKSKLINFKNTDKDYSKYISILSKIKKKNSQEKLKLFDYGCSWGYGSYKIKQAGYDVTAYEISKSRSKFAENKMGIKILPDIINVQKESFDFFFSAHVLEHLPEPKKTLDFGLSITKKDNYLVIFTPNGSFDRKKKDFYGWNKAWGLIHPNLIDEKFYKNIFFDQKYFITSSFDEDYLFLDKFLVNNENYCGKLDGEEILIIVKKIK